MRIRTTTRALLLLLASAALHGASAGDSYDYGIFASKLRDVDNATAFKALGPLVEHREARDDSDFFAIRPFYSDLSTPFFERSRQEYLWPLATIRHFKDQLNWRALILAHGIDFDVNDPQSPYRFRVLPIYFQGRNSAGKDYLAVFPLGGTIYDILGRDKATFVLFPLWARSSINDVVTTDWLWPIVSKTSGPGVSRFRVFPFYGYSFRQDRFRKRFILWPFWTDAVWTTPGESGSGFILFPLFGHSKTEIEETWNFLPPFFRFTDGEKRDLIYAPWPFFQMIDDEDLQKLYFWPLWGRKEIGALQSSFLLWPLGWQRRLDMGERERIRTMFLPFYYHFRLQTQFDREESGSEVLERYLQIWPLFAYEREGERSSFSFPELWPGPTLGPIERNWAPIWRLYTRQRRDDRVDTELLWGLFRHRREGQHARETTLFPLFSCERDGEDRGWSFLNGLAGMSRNGTNRTMRLLYIFEFGDGGDKQ